MPITVPQSEIDLSVVIPFYNEQKCVAEVCKEVRGVLESTYMGHWELIMVDDGSQDRTPRIMDRLASKDQRFRALHLHPNSGQSAALEAGFRAARGRLIATLDGDGQNDPADLVPLIREMEQREVDMMCGIRKRRADNALRRLSSVTANRIRGFFLGDRITDVGCSLRVFRRAIIRDIGFFRNAHRFFPALVQMRGFSVSEMPVGHRPRSHGTSKYGAGIRKRLFAGIVDLAGVCWLKFRSLRYTVHEAHDD